MSLLRLLLGALLTAHAALALAAPEPTPHWPSKPIRLLVGFPGGSTPDLSARVIAEPLAQALGQPVVVENRPGASGNISTDLVAKASDDHTLGIVINGNLTSSKLLYPQLPYDPAKDFYELSLLTVAPLVLVTLSTMPEGQAFLSAAKASGNQWNYGSPGVGTLGHLGMELIKSRLPGMDAEHIPYSGNPQIVNALLGGQLQLALLPPVLAAPHIKTGKLKAIGVAGGRSTLAPSFLPLAELGLRDLNLEVWNALIGPASLSLAARARLTGALTQVMKQPEVRQALFDRGWQPVGTSPEGLQRRVQEEGAAMKRIIRAQGIQLK